MKNQNQLTIKLRQSLSQSQVQFLQMLTMTNQEMDQFLQEESLENPLLERREPLSVSYRLDDRSRTKNRKKSGSGDGNKLDFLMNIPQPEAVDFRTMFTDQLTQSDFNGEQWKAVLFCIDFLDDRGYFPSSAAEIAINRGISLDNLNFALRKLRKLDPCGCFASDLSDCLQLQLKRRGNKDEKLEMLIRDCLDDLLKQRISMISRKLAISSRQVKKYIACIAALNPRPLDGLTGGESSYIIPDIVCSFENGRWMIGLNSSFFGSYGLSDFYCMMMHEAEKQELRDYFKEKFQRVKMILSNVEQRRKMLLRLTELLLHRQQDFFRSRGPLCPFTMTDAAKLLNVNPSTITRAVSNKWLQWPNGAISMKSLFTASVTDKAEISVFQIKEVLNGFVQEEDPGHPYSDSELAEMLSEKGWKISRRTVAKYRSELGILSWYDRRHA